MKNNQPKTDKNPKGAGRPKMTVERLSMSFAPEVMSLLRDRCKRERVTMTDFVRVATLDRLDFLDRIDKEKRSLKRKSKTDK